MKESPISLSDYERIVFFTGAGMSAESGVPTYRGKGGVWKEYDYEEYACQVAFDRDPAAVWEFHNYRRQLVADCAPNIGHEIIANWERPGASVKVVTQNIDGLHQRAGNEQVLELHGSLWKVRDELSGLVKEQFDVPFNAQIDFAQWWRPDIVWFGDSLRGDVVREAIEAISSCDLFISIGTSAVVYPAAELPYHARDHGATCVEINPEETRLSSIYHHSLRMTASEALTMMSAT